MTTKTIEHALTSTNGNGIPDRSQGEATSHRLTAFQERYMKRLVGNFERAKALVDAAQNAANEFIVACGEESGIQVGADGWTFDIDTLEFVRVPQGQAMEE